MRYILIISVIIISSCNNQHEELTDFGNNDTTSSAITDIYYESSDLLRFFDSINHSDCAPLQLGLTRHVDSVFSNRIELNRSVSPSAFEKLKQSVEFGSLDLKTGKEIFNFPLDSDFIKNGYIEISFFPFEKAKDKFGKFAIVIGSLLGTWQNDIYFFDGPTIIAKHHNYHKNGDYINWFVDSDGNTVIYYLENFGGGSGIWQYNYFFYKYLNGRLVPVLNILENGNLHWSSADNRHFWFESTVVQKVPLKLKLVYSYELSDYHFNWTQIKSDSTEVVFTWDKNTSKYIGQFADKLKMNQIYSYYLDDKVDLYNLYIDKKHLSSILYGHDSTKRRVVLFYINKLKNDIRIKKQGI